MRRAVAVVLILGLIPAVVGGCTSSSPPPPAMPGACTSPEPPSHGALSDCEFTVAVKIARAEVKQDFIVLVSATATVGPGKVTGLDAGGGHPCTSGTLLYVKVIGKTHRIQYSPDTRIEVRDLPDEDEAVSTTADPTTGLACTGSYQPVDARPDAGATVLFTR